MTDERANPFEKGQLKREAIDWWVIMHDADADAHQDEFKAWLERGALHRAAYNRVSQIYGTGKKVNWDTIPPDRHVRGTVRRAALSVLGMIIVCGFIGWRLIVLTMSGTPTAIADQKPTAEQVQLLTKLGEIREVRLPDGSRLTLDTDTLVSVDFRADEREIRLEHGRARFDVAHERRRFAVDAGEGQIVAHGTIFDVALWDDRAVHVHLLRGSVTVRGSSDAPLSGGSDIAVLHQGQAVSYPARPRSADRLVPALEQSSNWPDGTIEVSGSTLGAVLDAANRYSATKIGVADPVLRQIAVSGVFRIDDPRRLAVSLSLLLGLKLTSGSAVIMLSRLSK